MRHLRLAILLAATATGLAACGPTAGYYGGYGYGPVYGPGYGYGYGRYPYPPGGYWRRGYAGAPPYGALAPRPPRPGAPYPGQVPTSGPGGRPPDGYPRGYPGDYPNGAPGGPPMERPIGAGPTAGRRGPAADYLPDDDAGPRPMGGPERRGGQFPRELSDRMETYGQ